MKPEILCIEDDGINSYVIKTILKYDFRVRVCRLASEGLEELRKKFYPAVIIDINPGRGKMKGMQLMKEIRQLPSEPPHLMAMTAYALPGDKKRLLEAGFDSYFSKPVERESLISQLKNIYESHPQKSLSEADDR